jgi:exodeoxyribonuclease VII large subunit
MSAALTHAVRAPAGRQGIALAQLQQRLARHRPDLRSVREKIASEQRHLSACMGNQLKRRRESLAALAAQLELLNPQRTLERGYAIVSDAKGHVLRAPGQIKVNEALRVRLAEGSAEVGVANVQSLLD